MIQLTGPHWASDEGSCNACTSQLGPNGLKPGESVFTLSLSKGNSGGPSFRLCFECLLDLTELLQRIASKT